MLRQQDNIRHNGQYKSIGRGFDKVLQADNGQNKPDKAGNPGPKAAADAQKLPGADN